MTLPADVARCPGALLEYPWGLALTDCYYGPKCARLAGLLAPKARKAVRTRNAHDSAEADPRQMALELAA